jgi:hypothetical protein
MSKLCDDGDLIERVYAAMLPVLGDPAEMARAAIKVVEKHMKKEQRRRGGLAEP